MERCIAVVLAAGSGKRMNSEVKKQYIQLDGKPLMYYALMAFERSCVDEIICVVSPGDEAYVKKEVIDRYSFSKVSHVIAGGKERYDSVYRALSVIDDDAIVLIHDGARPFLTERIIEDNIICVQSHGACITAVPCKDTIKVIGESGEVSETPDRRTLWQVQTPQSFFSHELKRAYEQVLSESGEGITDDAMIMERAGKKVHVVMGDYNNIKVTTPEDLPIASCILQQKFPS